MNRNKRGLLRRTYHEKQHVPSKLDAVRTVIAFDSAAPFLNGDLNATALIELEKLRIELALNLS